MSGGWWIALVSVGVLAWAIAIDIRYKTGERLARWWVTAVRRRSGSAAMWSFLISTAAVTGYLVLAAVAAALADLLGNEKWALLVVLPAMLAYAPFVFETMPANTSGYEQWREYLAASGADRKLQRAIAWSAGLPSLLGLTAMIVTLFPIFLK